MMIGIDSFRKRQAVGVYIYMYVCAYVSMQRGEQYK